MKGKRKKSAVTDKELKQALIKKALGYDVTEVVEEYLSGDDGDVKLAKKKVSVKSVPPDMTALKILMDEQECNVSEMSDDELIKEKKRLLNLLDELNSDKEMKN